MRRRPTGIGQAISRAITGPGIVQVDAAVEMVMIRRNRRPFPLVVSVEVSIKPP